jgi:hypothetical protein
LIAPDGTQEQVMLQPGLKRTVFPSLKVYEPQAPAIQGKFLIRNTSIASDEEALVRLRNMHQDAIERTAIFGGELGEPPRIPTSGTSLARFVRQPGPPERLLYRRSEGAGDGYLVVDDAWFPGWRAEVDGTPATVYRVNVGYKAVYVPAEGQTVVLTYAPRSLVVGALVTAGAVIVAILLAFNARLWTFARRIRRGH